MKIRKLFIISPIGLVLLVGLVLAWWYLGDDAWIKGKVEETVSEMTGRSLSIDGPFSIDWSTSPVLLAEDIHFSNPSWATHEDLVELDRLELSVDLFSLIKDQTKITYIELDGLVVALEQRAHDLDEEMFENSWEIEELQSETDTAAAEPDSPLPVIFDRISLTGFTLLHEAPDRTVPLDFYLEQLQLTQGADQKLQINSDGRFGGEQFDVNGSLGPLEAFVAGGKTSHDIRLTLGDIELTSKGSIEQTSTLSGANINLVFSGPEFEWLLTQFAMPQFSHGDFDFKLDLQTEGDQTRLSLDGDLGSLQANAQGGFKDLSNNGDADLVASISGENLGGLLDIFDITGVPQNPFNMEVDISHASALYQLRTLTFETGGNSVSVSGQMGDWPQLADTGLDISISGPDLHSWKNALDTQMLPDTDFELTGRLERVGTQPANIDTDLRLGDSRFLLSGSLGKLPQMTGADLKLVANGPVDGALIRMLEIEGIPGQNFSLNAILKQEDTHFVLDGVNLDLAGTQLELSGQLDSLVAPGNGEIVFSLGVQDLSQWSTLLQIEQLPVSALTVNGTVGLADKELTVDDLKLVLGDNDVQINGMIKLDDQLEGSSFQTQLTLPNLAKLGSLVGVEGLPGERLSMNGNFQRKDGAWAFQLSDGLFANASFESDGKYTDRDGKPQVEATSHFSAGNLGQLARVAGVENLPEQPVDIRGFVRYETGKIEVRDLQGKVADTQFTLSANLVNPPDWIGSEINITASGQDLGQLLVNNDLEDRLPFSLQGRVARDQKNISIRNVKASLGALQASANGIIGNRDNLSATDLQFDVTAPSLKNVGDLIGFALPDEALSVNTRFQGSPSIFYARKLEIKLGASDLSGELNVNLEDKPDISGVFKSNYLDLAWLEDKTSDENEEAEPTSNASDQGGEEYLIPDSPITIPRIDMANVDLKVTFDEINFPHRTSSDVQIHTRVVDGNLYLDPFQTRGEDGGLLSGNLAIEREIGSEVTSVNLFLSGDDVKLGIGTVKEQDPDTMRTSNIVARLTGEGITYRDLAGSLNGHVELVQGPGLTGNAGLGLFFGNFIGELFDMLNPFSKTEEFTVNECAVIVASIESGVITFEPAVSHAEKMTIVAKGVADLNTEQINFTFNTKLRKGIGISASMVVNPFIGITGTLKSPIIGVDPAAVAVKGTVAVATFGMSLIVKSLSDRFLSSKDPCGDALKASREKVASDKAKESVKK